MGRSVPRSAAGAAGVAGVAVLALLAGALLPGGSLAAQDNGATEVAVDPDAAPAPFGPGENLQYQVKLGVVNVGEGSLRVEGVESVRGLPSYRLAMTIDAEAMFGWAKIHDRFESWLDTRMLVSRRFVRDIHEMNYKSRREFEIYPEEKRWERTDADQSGTTPSVLPLDEISFMYYARTLPLQVGETYNLNRYFKEDGNPVVVRVLRKERIEVPAGTFDAVVVQPTFQTDGLFGEGGEAELYFSDDEHRHLVYMRTKIPVVGSLSLHLTSAEVGLPLHPGTREEGFPPGAPD
jgi:hypothetical protein